MACEHEPIDTLERALECIEAHKAVAATLRAEERDTRNAYTSLKHSAGERISSLALQNRELLESLKEVVADATRELSYEIIGKANALINRIEGRQSEKQVCICAEFDGQGLSTCGVPCPVHGKPSTKPGEGVGG